MRPRRPSRRAGAAAALATVALGASAAPALADDAGSITVTSGNVTALLEWDRADFGVANPRLSITRSGTRYDLTIVDICDVGCILRENEPGDATGTSMLKVADLDADGEPEAIVDTYSGGAHCCVTARVFTWDGTGYAPKDIEWRDGTYRLEDLDGDGRPEMVGADPVFSAAFTAYAASAFPPMVLRVERGATVDVTRKFPKLIRADAADRLKSLRKAKRGDDIRGLLAAYVADQYLLGKASTAQRELTRQLRAHRITKAFKPYLLKRLRAWGYR